MKILVLSAYGESAYLWIRLVGEGHDLKVWIKDKDYRKEIYEGLVDKVPDYHPFVPWCDFVLIDQNDMVAEWKFCFDKKPTFGGSEIGNMLEKDRTFGHEVMKYIGLPQIESKTFKTIPEVQAHLKTHRVPHVVKPFGPKVGSEDIIISEDKNGEDAIALLHRFEERKIPFEGIEVEERKDGIEVGVGGFFNGTDWVPPFEINFEHKRFATGSPEGMGFLTGEMGTAMRYTSDPKNKVVSTMLKKMTTILRDTDYRGQVDISMIADKDGFWPLEFTTRLGYPALALNISLQQTPLGELFYGLACGKIKENKVKDDWSIGVVVVDYGFPFNDEVEKRSVGYPIFNVDEDNIDHIYMYEAKAGEHDDGVAGLVTSSGMGYPMVICGTGKTIELAQKDCYRFLDLTNPDRVRVPNSWWREDIGNRVIAKREQIIKQEILSKEEI